jgi:hypothetical protein
MFSFNIVDIVLKLRFQKTFSLTRSPNSGTWPLSKEASLFFGSQEGLPDVVFLQTSLPAILHALCRAHSGSFVNGTQNLDVAT